MKKRIKHVLVAISVMTLVVSSSTVFAGNDNIAFGFNISGKKVGYTTQRQRTTQYTDNAWKVRVEYSTEGVGTVSNYYLVRSDTNERCSDVRQATFTRNPYSTYYTQSTYRGCNTWVKMAGKNNNNTTHEYTVSGAWDEETERKPN